MHYIHLVKVTALTLTQLNGTAEDETSRVFVQMGIY
jgi:hypothetical protein